MYYFIAAIFWILQVYFMIMIVSIFLTWIPGVFQYKFFRVIRRIGNWYLRPFRGLLILGPIDFTPIIGIFLFRFIIGLL